MNILSKEAEDTILEAIQDVCQHVNGGDDPTDAVVKVAENYELTPNFVKLVCTGYNTGATTYQREKSAKILDKLAEFPIADYDSVIERLYPKTVVPSAILKQSSVVSDEYSRKPAPRQKVTTAEKTASADVKVKKTVVSPVEDRMARAYSGALAQKRAYETARAEYAKKQDDLLSTLGCLVDCVKAASYNERFNVDNLINAATLKFGAAGQSVADYLRIKLNHRSNTKQAALVTADWSSGPGLLVKQAIDNARAVVEAKREFEAFKQHSDSKIAELLAPFEIAQNPVVTEKKATILPSTTDSAPAISKQANGFLGGLLGSSIAKSLGTTAANTANIAKTPTDMAAGMADELDDPDHDNELRRIQTRAMMQDLMMNDEVISGYDPGEVMNAYNEIVNVTPRSATQPAIIRPLLRKRLAQGAIEPFEAAEMVNIEKNLGQTTARPSAVDSHYSKQGQANVLQRRIIV